MNKYYYAILNDNNVCIDIMAKVNKLPPNTAKHVPLQEYNEMYFHRKYDPETQWSHETYEPELDTVIQDRLVALELENNAAKSEVVAIQAQNNMLEGMLMEMMEMLATLTTPVGGAE